MTSVTSETIQMVVKEGLDARNLLNFISDGTLNTEMDTLSTKPPLSPRPQSVSPNPIVGEIGNAVKSTKRRTTLSRPKNRLRSASAGRNPEKNLRVRYWTFLFENLHRAVDEIYQTCEMDESIVESKEAIMMLENYSKDFHSLIQYININKNYEKTAPLNRPTSLAWEVRKSSPGKSLLKNVFIERITTGNSNAKRILSFDTPCEFASPSDLKPIRKVCDSGAAVIKESSSNTDYSIFRKNTVTDSGSQTDILLKNYTDMKISVVSAPDEMFPCNESLVIKEVQCHKNNVEVLSPDIDISNITTDDTGSIMHQSDLSISETKSTSTDSSGSVSTGNDNSSSNVDSSVKEDSVVKVTFVENKVVSKTKTGLNRSTKRSAVTCISAKNSKVVALPETKAVEKSVNLVALPIHSENTSQQDPKTIYKRSVSNLESKLKPIPSSQSQTVNASENTIIEMKNKPMHAKEMCDKSLKEVNPIVSSSTASSGKSQGFKNTRSSEANNRGILTTKANSAPRDTASSRGNHEAVAPKTAGHAPSNATPHIKVILPGNPETVAPKVGGHAASRETASLQSNHETITTKPTGHATSNTGTALRANHETSAARSAGHATSRSSHIPSESTTRKPSDSVANAVPKTKPAFQKTGDGARAIKLGVNESAIKRNISYVQSLSTRNNMEKTQSAKNSRILSGRSSKLSHHKSDSMSSLHRPSTARGMTRKTSSVEKIPEALKSSNDDDSDGWETVRGRNRCRNSPAKKIPFSPEDQALHFAKLSQSRIGGFPYTTKVNGKVVPKTTVKENQKKACLDSKMEKAAKKTRSSKPESCSQGKDVPLKQKQAKDSSNPNVSNSSGSINNISKASSGEVTALNKKILNARESLKLPDDVALALERDLTLAILKAEDRCRSSSLPDLNCEHEGRLFTLSKSLCISDQSLSTQKYININRFKKKLSERNASAAKRKHKKVKINDTADERMLLSNSLDESDNGLTSDDQDGPLSHDETFDVQCQELYDTAWKYKILEQQVHKLEMSWGEQMDLFDMELRTPGRALEMHEKLSSPFRKKSLFESIRVCNEKQLKAQEQRERLLEEKAQKFKIIQKKRQEMKSLIEQRQEKQRVIMEQKLQRAEEKRKKQLEMIIRKAHDEEEKVNEIAFINTLEAQNKRHELISKEKDHEARLHDIQEERQRKLEEKAAKEAAAEGRRKILEAERQARLTEMQEKRKMRDHKVEQLFLVKEKERQELANQKARDRELRLSALSAQQQNTIEELQKKIQLKQEESARRHEENMEQIRQKAFELSVRKCSSNNDDVPQPLPYETKKICTICNVLIGSEVYLLSHLHGKKHQEAVKLQYQGKDPSTEELELYNLKHIVDASTDQLDPNIAMDKERQKALKKRCKKLRQRMSTRGQEYESQVLKESSSANSIIKTKMLKISADIQKTAASVEEKGSGSSTLSSLERSLNEIDSLFLKKLHKDKGALRDVGGVSALINILSIASRLQVESNIAFLHKKFLNHCDAVITSVIFNSYDVCKYILLSNKIGNLLDNLIYCMNNLVPDNLNQLVNQGKSGNTTIPLDATAGKLLHLLTIILVTLSSESVSSLDNKENKSDDFHFRLHDVISYIVSIGIVDKFSQFFNCIQGPINNEDEVSSFLLDCIHFLTALIKLNSDCSLQNHKAEDSTQLIATFRVTNMVGTVSLLYNLLLHSGAPSRGEEPPPPLSKQMEVLAFSTLFMLNHMALTSLQAFQSILGSEGLSLQLRHITSYLLWYCSLLTSDSLLHEVILLVGYFTVLNPENQSIIQAGQSPSVLQQLCCLPFLYFSETELTDILFPTLIACCYSNAANKTILQQEMTSELLANYIEVKYLNGDESNSNGDKKNNYYKRWSFPARFPKCHWCPAKQYFSAN